MRRSQPRRARHLAVATALIAGVALAGCAQPDAANPSLSPGSSPSTTTTSPPASSPPTQSGATPSTPSDTAGPTAQGEAAERKVRAWLQAARDGDLAKLESGLCTYSREQAKKLGGLEGMQTGLAEGIAAFLDAKTWAAHLIPGHDNTWLVVASGEVTREGMTETDARTWIVHPESGHLVVETFATPVPQVVAPAPGQTLDAAKPVVVDLPAGDVVAFMDDQDAATHVSTENAIGGGARVTVQPPAGGWPAGRHVVAVATVPKNGQSSPWASVASAFTVG
ncbi:MAG TPA: hypothetical protein VFX33_02985 [Actinomycetales bacterium]|nr:hypothetical protein [Actinomycetales bacterium]